MSDVVHTGIIDFVIFRRRLIIVGRDICSFNRPSSVGRKTECCLRYTTETVGPTEFNFDMYN